MQAVFVLYVLLVVSSLLDFLIPWTGLEGLRLIVACAGLVGAAGFMTERESAHLPKALGFALVGFVILLAWMFLQWLPLSLFPNSVWSSASSALGVSLSGHVSIDLPATLRSMGDVSLAASMMVLGAIVTTNRNRAEQSLTCAYWRGCPWGSARCHSAFITGAPFVRHRPAGFRRRWNCSVNWLRSAFL